MAGTNLLSVADKVLPTIIGVVSFLGALLIVIGSVLYIITKTSHTQNGICTLKIQYFS